ncbi:MAG: hypothetical protein IT166_17760 [Bryobacterales bacterium]|nr:hypothetical protein [Bryobacterales bacterium]
MRSNVRTWLLGLAALSLASSAFAGPVSFKLTGTGSGATMGGVYTSPYNATIDGVPVLAICDDFGTHSYIDQTFNAAVTNVASLQGEATSDVVKFDKDNAAKQQADYATVAYLAIQLLGIDQSTAAGKKSAGLYSFALWSIFTPTALNSLSGQNFTDAKDIRDNALAMKLTPGAFGNVDIYTPSPDQGVSQEFIVVRTDEPGAAALLGFNILAVFSLVFFLRKRLIRAV